MRHFRARLAPCRAPSPRGISRPPGAEAAKQRAARGQRGPRAESSGRELRRRKFSRPGAILVRVYLERSPEAVCQPNDPATDTVKVNFPVEALTAEEELREQEEEAERQRQQEEAPRRLAASDLRAALIRLPSLSHARRARYDATPCAL